MSSLNAVRKTLIEPHFKSELHSERQRDTTISFQNTRWSPNHNSDVHALCPIHREKDKASCCLSLRQLPMASNTCAHWCHQSPELNNQACEVIKVSHANLMLFPTLSGLPRTSALQAFICPCRYLLSHHSAHDALQAVALPCPTRDMVISLQGCLEQGYMMQTPTGSTKENS